MFNKLRQIQLQPWNDNLGVGLKTPWFLRQSVKKWGLLWDWQLNWNAENNVWTNWTATNVTYPDSNIWYQKQVWEITWNWYVDVWDWYSWEASYTIMGWFNSDVSAIHFTSLFNPYLS